MNPAARVFLLITGTILLAHYMPAGFWLVADERQRAPVVFYSCIEDRFLLLLFENGEARRSDPAGAIYEREEFERLLPLDNYLQLYRDGRMPSEIDGVAITPERLRRERINLRLRPAMLDSPSAGLVPLFDAESGRARLETPGDMMRLGRSVEFLDVKANRALPEKTARFQNAFAGAGFVFPARLVGGNPVARKPYDEGYFLVDAAGEFFHLRQARGEPQLRRLADFVAPGEKARWARLRPRHLHVQEQNNREVRLLIVGEAGDVHLVAGEDYRLVTLPLSRFDPATMQLWLRGDLLNRLVTVTSGEHVEAVVMSRDYEFVDRHTETWTPREDRPAGRLAAALFPFTLNFESEGSGYLGFHLARGNWPALAMNLGLLAALAGWWRVRKRPLAPRLPELAAVGVGGVFGLALVWLLPKTE